MSVQIRIYTCPEWGAVPAKSPTVLCPPSVREIFHHTAGHHAEISLPASESQAEAFKYARDIQRFHMVTNGWNDSGHNFLICRNGMILQGRWRTVSAIQAKKMVVSAHCPGQNNQIGVEHEHLGNEAMTEAQFESTARLSAWISFRYGLKHPLPIHAHREYFATACPANLANDMSRTYARAQVILNNPNV
jgi:hypothetical protein